MARVRLTEILEEELLKQDASQFLRTSNDAAFLYVLGAMSSKYHLDKLQPAMETFLTGLATRLDEAGNQWLQDGYYMLQRHLTADHHANAY